MGVLGKKTTVLIADNEENIRHLIRKMLGKRYAVLEVKNGVDAVEVTHTHNPDIILLDMFMPIIDGRTTCSELQSDVLARGIPLVAISGDGGPLEEKLVRAMGAKGYLSRPFTKRKLQNILTPILQATSGST